jgi:hypothetical protein
MLGISRRFAARLASLGVAVVLGAGALALLGDEGVTRRRERPLALEDTVGVGCFGCGSSRYGCGRGCGRRVVVSARGSGEGARLSPDALVALARGHTVAPASSDAAATARAVSKSLVHRGCGCCFTSESMVVASLRWLARHQSRSGAWDPAGFGEQCRALLCPGAGRRELEVPVTAVAVLAFLEGGFTPASRDFYVDRVTGERVETGQVVRNALQWLVELEREHGRIAESAAAPVLDQAFATLALAEAFKITNAASYGAPLRRAVVYLEASREPGRGFGAVERGSSDLETTTWALMALGSAKAAGLEVDLIGFEEAHVWLERASVSLAERDASPATWACALLGQLLATERDGALFDRTRAAVLGESPVFASNAAAANDPVFWYRAALGLIRSEGPHSQSWNTWIQKLRASLAEHQHAPADGCLDGSWDPCGGAWERAGGRVFVTALSCLALEVYYRYVRADEVGLGPRPTPTPSPSPDE